MKLDNILEEAIERKASDIHLTIGIEPMARINGKLETLNDQIVTSRKTKEWVKKLNGTDDLQDTKEIDFAYHFRDYRLRINAFRQQGVWAIAIRIIPNEIKAIDELGIPEKIKEIIEEPRGLFLVTGPTGSGKSTTLASMINNINANFDKHIITLEDPIEYVHDHQKSIVNQRTVGKDTASFADGLKSALRQDPDVILVGEMRDLETISTAIMAAETGHLVFGTLHTNNAAETVERVINVFPPHQQSQVRMQLSLSLLGVLSQQLLPTVSGSGRVVATELLLTNSAVKNLIREGKVHQISSVLQSNRKAGMHSMDYSLRDLYLDGEITLDTALSRAINKKTLKNIL